MYYPKLLMKTGVSIWVLCHSYLCLAEYQITQSKDLSKTAWVQINAVTFSQNKPWFGMDEENLGVHVDEWLEIAVKPELTVLYTGIDGYEVNSKFSFVSTKDWGETNQKAGCDWLT